MGESMNDYDEPLKNVSDLIVLKRFNARLRSSHKFDWCVIECVNESVIECVNERCAMSELERMLRKGVISAYRMSAELVQRKGYLIRYGAMSASMMSEGDDGDERKVMNGYMMSKGVMSELTEVVNECLRKRLSDREVSMWESECITDCVVRVSIKVNLRNECKRIKENANEF
ncbi:hypothetical protein DPMN_039785 [Dreissena polymorpha]|uniref:Uncharacterized protein n=1 Tax=Dreissena polymorpha TaxID=45954 RepID=A0A9D4HUK7_DREPO|nr:hypothetical protein DPMN_039785 [Dreissena polymorpha]